MSEFSSGWDNNIAILQLSKLSMTSNTKSSFYIENPRVCMIMRFLVEIGNFNLVKASWASASWQRITEVCCQSG